jgi:DNA-binding CsgD family transcriptional regulator
MEGLLSLSDRDYPHAEKCFVHACQLWQDHPVSRIVGDPRLLLAAAYYGWGRPSDALRVIELPLAEHRRNATPGLLLIHGTAVVDVLGLAVERGILPEFAAPLLQSLESLTGPRSQTVSSTGETLTAREVEILRLLSTGASNAQIADSLVIGLPTVKTHVSRVLAKLDARSRTEAVTVARDLRIL